MKIHTADYIKSAPSLKECPDFGATPELALVGRSNVGKSSFINSLTQRKNLARTSNTPGKTRYINFYAITYSHPGATGSGASGKDPERLIFVDLPGYGYAKVSHAEQERWRTNLEAYLARRDGLRGVIQMIDARHGPQDNDIRMFEWLQFHGKRTIVVMTKTDKLNRAERSKNTAAIAHALGLDAASILSYSAETHQGRDVAWQTIQSVLIPFPAFQGMSHHPDLTI
jgi:GTP-binding protein